MAGDWRETTLGDVIELKRGYDLPQQQRLPGQVPLVSSSGVTDHHAVAMVKGPGVVTGRYGTLGQVFFVAEDFWPLNTTLYVRDFKGNDPRFISYFLRELDFQAYSDKAAVPGLNRNHLHQARVRVPNDVDEQRAIAHILGTLDDKIELNRRMNATLEEMARALFKSWFVDFDPVRAKAEGRDTGLPPTLADLFPDAFEESELGEVPKGWRVGSILECAELLSGGTPSTSIPEYWGGDIPWVSAKDISAAHGLFVIDTERKITDPGVKNSSTKLLPKNTTIVTARGTVGSYCLLGREMAMNQTNYGLKAKAGVGDFFVFFSLANLVRMLQQHAYGTIFDTVTTKTFQSTAIVHPSDSALWCFEQQVAPLMDRILLNIQQSRTLAALRDTLLPKLISGELRIKDAETFLETAP